MRQAGILLHISSLPGPGGLGCMGKEAYAFADFLQKAGMKIWQVLPMGPTGYGESPYQSTSVYAGNPRLISLHLLRDEGLVDFADCEEQIPASEVKADFDGAAATREMLLRRCFAQSGDKLLAEVDSFVRRSPWVEDFALFTACKQYFNNILWTRWPDRGLRMREESSLSWYRQQLAE